MSFLDLNGARLYYGTFGPARPGRALIVLAFTFLGDGVRDALDPRLRGTQ